MIKLVPIKPTVTQKHFAAVVKAVEAQTRQSAGELLKDFERTAATWTNKPRWRVRVGRSGVSVSTDDAIWGYVDRGTRPHVIRPRRAKRLAFAGSYTAKTRVGSIIARGGGPSGSTVFAREVNHPGTKPRNFTRLLKRKWDAKWPRDMQKAINRATQ